MYGLMGGGIRPASGRFSGGIHATSASSTVFAGSFQGTHATTGRGLQVLDHLGNNIFKVGEQTGHPVVSMNLINGIEAASSNVQIFNQMDESWVMMDMDLSTSGTTAADMGAMRATIHSTHSGTKLLRAIEAHSFADTGATGTTAWVQEWGVHNRAAVNTNNNGVYLLSSSWAWWQTVLRCEITAAGTGYVSAPTVTFSAPAGGGVTATGTASINAGGVTGITITNGGSGYTSAPTVSFSGGGGSGATATAHAGYRNGMAFYAGGEDGWTDFLKWDDRDGTNLFKVSGSGVLTGGNVLPRANNTYTLGTIGTNWLAAYITAIVAGVGAANGPSVTTLTDTTSGLFFGSGFVGLTASAVERARADAGGFAFGSGFRVQENTVATITPSQITAQQDNYNPTGLSTASRLRLSSDASRDVTGIVAQTAGTVLHLQNVGAQNIVLKHETTSTAANRFSLPSATDVTIPLKGAYSVIYDGTLARWVQYVG